MNIDPARSSTPFASVVDVEYTGKKSILLNHRRFRVPDETFLGSVHDTKPKNIFVHSTEPTKGSEK